MVLDPFAALSLASSIVQFVDFSAKLFDGSKELYHATNGQSSSNATLQLIAKDLSQLAANLELDPHDAKGPGKTSKNETPRGVFSGIIESLYPTPQSHEVDATLDSTPREKLSRDEKSLRNLATSCRDVAQILLLTLDDLTVRGPNKRWQSVRQAFRSVWKEKKIKEMERRLDTIRDQLTFHLVTTLKDRQSEVFVAINRLSDETKSVELKNANKLDQLRNELVDTIRNISTNSSSDKDLSGITLGISSLLDESHKLRKQQIILQSLCFKHMRTRRANIVEAHDKTFDWVFREYDYEENPRHDFCDWLRTQNGVFWISGKAGSGKSTLLKYICSSETTKLILKEWAQSRTLVLASFYFWNAGTEMEKSQEGMLMSLIFEILRRVPSMIPLLLPELWQESDLLNSHQIQWTRSELLALFTRLVQEDIPDVKFCIFLDGLDEYTGDHLELAKLVKKFATSSAPNIKICVSSRPWNAYQEAFGSSPGRSLRLQDFTKPDIQRYVNDILGEVPNFSELRYLSPEYLDLVSEIVENARGVFLWVFLACKFLSQGLTNRDRTSELLERIRTLPPDLETYFMHMIRSIEPFYRKQTAQLLLAALAAEGSLSLFTLSFFDEKDQKRAVDARVEPMDATMASRRSFEMQTRINARCQDLLETRSYESKGFTHYRADFLHRTVRDFLLTRDIQDELRSRVDTDFDEDDWLCRAFLASLKFTSMSELDCDIWLESARGVLYHTRSLEVRSGQSQREILYEFDRVLANYSRVHGPIRDYGICYTDEPLVYKEGMIIYLAVIWRFPTFLQEELNRNADLFSDAFGDFMLGILIRLHELIDLRVLKLLFAAGVNPNCNLIGGPSIWQSLLGDIYKRVLDEDPEYDPTIMIPVLEIFLSNGANPNIFADTNNPKTVKEIFQAAFGEATAESILQKARPRNRLNLLNYFKLRRQPSPAQYEAMKHVDRVLDSVSSVVARTKALNQGAGEGGTLNRSEVL